MDGHAKILRDPVLRHLATYRPEDPGPTLGDIRDAIDRFEDNAALLEALLSLQRDGLIGRSGYAPWRWRLTEAGGEQVRRLP